VQGGLGIEGTGRLLESWPLHLKSFDFFVIDLKRMFELEFLFNWAMKSYWTCNFHARSGGAFRVAKNKLVM